MKPPLQNHENHCDCVFMLCASHARIQFILSKSMAVMIAHKPFVTNHVLSSITLEKRRKGEELEKKVRDKECQMATLS